MAEPAAASFAAMRDKDVDGMFRHAAARGRQSRGDARVERALGRAAGAGRARARHRPGLPIAIEPSVEAALAAAWRQSPRIVVAGSIFLLGDVMKLVDAT